MRSLKKYLQISLLLWLSAILAGCLMASFTVSNNPTAGVAVQFDASGSMAFAPPKNNVITSYAWNFGDGSKGTGQKTSHTYAKSGSYKVTLTVTDTSKEVKTTSQTINVAAATVTQNLSVLVRNQNNAFLPNATVSVGGATATTDTSGNATITAITAGTGKVITVSKAGYITQAVQLDVAAGSNANTVVTLKEVGQSQTYGMIELAQTFTATQTFTANLASYSKASVTVPVNAFVVKATGAAAIGVAKVQLTPWNITNSAELLTMPGNGLSKATDGTMGTLISAGMMDVNVTDANGQALQLASGKTATIQMDLPKTSINGQALSVGSTIPLWHFDETQGMWLQESTPGTVVPSNTSPTGLAVQATVSHFSTWNWDFQVQSNSGTSSTPITVKCTLADGTAAACNVDVIATMPDGSQFSPYHPSGIVPTTGTTLMNMPSTGTFTWTGTLVASGNTTSYTGTVTTTAATTTVTIVMPQALTGHFVQCQLATGNAGIACIANLQTSSGYTLTNTIPAEGAKVFIPSTETNLTWAATTTYTLISNGTLWTNYTGSLTEATLGTSTIIPMVQGQTYTAPAVNPTFTCSSQISTQTTIQTCNLEIIAYDETSSYTVFSGIVAADTPIPVYFNNLNQSANVKITASSIDSTGVNVGSTQFSTVNAINQAPNTTLILLPFGGGGGWIPA